MLQEPLWRPLFERYASASARVSFHVLARGASEQRLIPLESGLIVDLYGSVLIAMAETGPLTSVDAHALRNAMQGMMAITPPEREEIEGVLQEMSGIAHGRDDGEPVVDYDNDLRTLYISDPYFAYFLRWRAAAELSQIDYGTSGRLAAASAASGSLDLTHGASPREKRTEVSPPEVRVPAVGARPHRMLCIVWISSSVTRGEIERGPSGSPDS